MLTHHFEAKLVAVKQRATALELITIPFSDSRRIKGLIKEAEGTLPLSARNAFLEEALDIINQLELRLMKEAVTI